MKNKKLVTENSIRFLKMLQKDSDAHSHYSQFFEKHKFILDLESVFLEFPFDLN